MCELDFVNNIANNNFFYTIDNHLTLKSIYNKEKYIYDTINSKAKSFGETLVKDIDKWIIEKEDFYKITEDLKTLNQEKRSIESDIALSKLEIKDLKYDLEKKKNIILDKEGYLKTLKEMEINKFSSHFEELNEILLKNT